MAAGVIVLLAGAGGPETARCGEVGALASRSPAPAVASTFERGRRDLMKVALTFDGGSDAGYTARILEILREKAVTATFFLTGRYISNCPELALDILAGGHEVGNHTWSHAHLTTWDRTRSHETRSGVDPEFLGRELDRTARAWRELTGTEMTRYWRAPYGEINTDILRWAGQSGRIHVGWTRAERGRMTLDSLDWVTDRSSRNYLSSAQIASRLLSFGAATDGLNGGIVLMHLSTPRQDPGVLRLPALIDALRDRGYRIVAVSELLEDVSDPAPPALRTASIDTLPPR